MFRRRLISNRGPGSDTMLSSLDYCSGDQGSMPGCNSIQFCVSS